MTCAVPMADTSRTAVIVLLLVVGVAGAIFVVARLSSGRSYYRACTQEARRCPDGSFVGRTGPSCEFAACPDVPPLGWRATTTADAAFWYPVELSAVYVTPADWPPSVQVAAGPFACTEGGSQTARAGVTSRRVIEGRVYCVTAVSEGAAGSIYTMYAYAFEKGGKVLILTFSLRAVQCANYDEPERQACETERASFDEGPVIDRIAQTLALPSSATSTVL